jgi:ABC-type dipeptide/oligopeptide/nickel transport system permease subunit
MAPNEAGGSDRSSPAFRLRAGLRQHKGGLAGLLIIAAAGIIALLGYLIMPDPSPNANDGAVQIAKQPPGFEATFLKFHKEPPPPRRGPAGRALLGQESAFLLLPVTAYRVDGLRVHAQLYGKAGEWVEYGLPEMVYGLPPGVADTAAAGTAGQAVLEFDGPDGALRRVPYAELRDLFGQQHVETRRYLLGTDRAGRDLLSRLLYGTRISLSVGLAAVAISMLIGIIVGTLGGYFGGRTDAFLVWLMSVVWSIPGIMLVIAISIALQSRGLWVVFVAVGLTMWVEVARTVRGEMLALREKQYVEAARAFGFSDFRIVFRHIMPNMTGTLIAVATANFASAILLEAGLSFLGLGVQPPTPSWGMMIYEGFQAIGTKNSWHLILFPALAICIMVLSFNLLGSGLRDATDPNNQSI